MSDPPPQLPPGPDGPPSAGPPAQTYSPAPRVDQASEDREHLKLLVIFHYVLAGLTALGACFPIIHLVVGLFLVTGGIPAPEQDEHVPMAVGWIFVAVAGCMIVLGMALAVCIFLAARNLQKRTGHTFCFVVACMMCMMFPFGTALGVFTIIVLNRPTVKALFAGYGTDAVSEFERSVG